MHRLEKIRFEVANASAILTQLEEIKLKTQFVHIFNEEKVLTHQKENEYYSLQWAVQKFMFKIWL